MGLWPMRAVSTGQRPVSRSRFIPLVFNKRQNLFTVLLDVEVQRLNTDQSFVFPLLERFEQRTVIRSAGKPRRDALVFVRQVHMLDRADVLRDVRPARSRATC